MILHLSLLFINFMILQIAAWNVKGMCSSLKPKEIKKFIRVNGISLCGIIETQLRKKFVEPVCNNVFAGWDWISNSNLSKKGVYDSYWMG